MTVRSTYLTHVVGLLSEGAAFLSECQLLAADLLVITLRDPEPIACLLGLRITCNAGLNDLQLLRARDGFFRTLIQCLLHLSLEMHAMVGLFHLSPLTVIHLFKEEAEKGQKALDLVDFVF